MAAPQDPNVMAGTADVAAPDAPEAARAREAGTGYLWDAALRRGLTLRNYGFFGDLSRSFTPLADAFPPTLRDPFAAETQVFFPSKASLVPHSDPYFLSFDQKVPDFWRVKEWEREFDAYVKAGTLPDLTLLRLAHDHFGSFAEAVDGVNTVETQMADNDYAIGLVVEKVAASPFAADTLIFIIEDDAQNGADHVDSHRSIALVVGPYVRQRTVISEPYMTVSILRTIEDVLGIPPLGLNDGLTEPMAEVFDPDQPDWTYKAIAPEILRTTALPMPDAKAAEAGGCFTRPVRTAAYWEAAMAGQNFEGEDRLDSKRFNEALWRGLRGDRAIPTSRHGEDLSQGRAARLAAFRKANGCTG